MKMRVVGLSILAIGLGLVVYGCEKREVATEPTEPAQAAEATEATESGKEAAMGLTLQWLGHASFRISHEDTVIYIDPWKLKQEPHDASLVLVSHSHSDHYSAGDIAKVRTADTKLVASADVVEKEGLGEALMPGLTVESAGIRVIGVPAYNPNKRFHPRQNNWLGFIIEVGGKRIYYAGDTDLTDEMRALQNIDVALLPAGGTYTMNAEEAAEATKHLKPNLAIPYHWGDIVGKRSDAEKFAELADCEAKVLSPGDTVSLE
jgi:L-ascorbate metabolism protein UlaG (beta-lactamase superfamily)